MHTFSSLARARLAACLFLSVLGFALPARAWKPITHVYLAEKAREELLAQNGSITLHEVDFRNRQQLGALGTWQVSAPLYEALRDYPAYYRAGVLGPDAYPDILFGQSVIHPSKDGNDGGSDSDPWLRHLYSQADTPQERAFVLGFLAHAAGDMYAHTYVNHYAGGPFAFANDNAKMHIVTEGHVGRRTPFLGDQPSGDPARYSIDTSAVNDFIYENLIDARRARTGTSSNRVWELTRHTRPTSLPRLFTELRAGLEDKLDGYYEHVKWLKRQVRDNLDRCAPWRPGACAKAAYYQGLLVAYTLINGVPVHFMEAWVRDINRGLKAWPATSTEVARLVFMQTDHKAKFSGTDGAEEVLSDYSDDYLCSMMGSLDATCWVAAKVKHIIDEITPEFEVYEQLKHALLNLMVKLATDEDYDYWKGLMDPESSQVDTHVPANPADGTPSSVQMDRLMGIDDNDNPKLLDTLAFAPAYNTYAAIKMSFLDTRSQWQSVLGTVNWSPGNLNVLMDQYDNQNGFNGQFMLGFVRSMDWDNQWAVPKRMFLAQNCHVYNRFFMQQTGDLWELDPTEPANQALIDQRDAWCELGGNKLEYTAFFFKYSTRDIPLMAGEVLTLGTCGVNGASGWGDTRLALLSPSGANVANSDDACGSGLSHFTYTVPAGGTGTYTLYAGCGMGPCSGTVVWTISGSFSYGASNTSSATTNTFNRNLSLVAGQRLRIGTCRVAGASGNGDTYLRLITGLGTQVAANDDDCGGQQSYIEYLVPGDTNATYQMRAGCFENTSCSGTVSYLLTDASL